MNVVVVSSMGHAMPLPRTSSVPLQINGYFLNRSNRRSFSFLRILIRANGRGFKFWVGMFGINKRAYVYSVIYSLPFFRKSTVFYNNIVLKGK